jgi:endonuclease YncB( thermonuclease family)
LRKEVEGKEVWCQLLIRDQYKRIVGVFFLFCKESFAQKNGQVAVPLIKSAVPFRKNCVSLLMLKAGWATVYEQSYAEYGKWGKEYFLSVLAEAQ